MERPKLTLVVNNVPKKPPVEFLNGPDLIRALVKLPTVQDRENLIVNNLSKLGF